MATEYVTGKIMYARVFESNRDMKGYEDKHVPYDGFYEVCIGVPEYGPDYKKFMSWNRMYSPKIGGKDKGFETDRGAVEGLAYFRVGRKHAPKRANGEVITKWGGQPKLLDADNKDWDTNVLIGNGSDATIKLAVESSKTNPKINFVRLEAVRIETLVPYERKEEVAETAKATDKVVNKFEDDIPFDVR